jgi:carbon storage regulator
MLVLSRKAGECIRIDDQIIVQVVQISRSRVRIAIDAPKSVAVHRLEVFESIQNGNLDEQQTIRRPTIQ